MHRRISRIGKSKRDDRFGSVAEARLISSTFQGHIKIEANGYPEGVLP